MITEKLTVSDSDFTIDLYENQISSIKNKHTSNIGFRVYKNGTIGISSGTENIDENLLKQRALDSLQYGISYNSEVWSNYKKHIIIEDKTMNFSVIKKHLPILFDKLKYTYPNYIFSSQCELSNRFIHLENSNNLDLLYRNSFINFKISMNSKYSADIFDGVFEFNCNKFNLDLILSNVTNICNAYKNNIKTIEKGVYPIIFIDANKSPLYFLVNELNGKYFAEKKSKYSDNLNNKIFNNNFSLIQTSHPKESFYPFFDAEGTINNNFRYTLIKNGILKAVYTDKSTALNYNLPLTGSAYSKYNEIPKLGIPTYKVEDTGATLKQILNGKKAIIPMIAPEFNYGIDGSLSSIIPLSLLYDGDKFIGRLPYLQINIPNLYSLFKENYIGRSRENLFFSNLNNYVIFNMMVNPL